jgi:hypothetical protein
MGSFSVPSGLDFTELVDSSEDEDIETKFEELIKRKFSDSEEEEGPLKKFKFDSG